MSSAPTATRIDDFRAAVSTCQLRTAGDTHMIDGVRPSVIAAPADETELAKVLTAARDAGLAAIPIGGGAHLTIGNTPDAYDIALSTERLNATIDHEPGDLTVVVDAGVRLIDLQAALAERGQTLLIDPPCDDAATIGGVLAVNGFGPRRHAYGTLRDWLIGLRVAGVDGRVTKSGGRVVKNVTGYDMHKLHIGALGTLGVITQATFKVAPLPHTTTTIAATFDSARDACALIVRARDAGLALHAAEAMSPLAAQAVLGEARWALMLRVAGSQAAVERSQRDLASLMAELSGTMVAADTEAAWQHWSRTFRPRNLSLRCSVLPSAIADTLDGLDRRLAGSAKLSATVCAGVIRIDLQAEDGRAPELFGHIRATLDPRGGTMIIDAAPLDLKRECDVFGPSRSDLSIMRRLKHQLDPDRTLAPGRFMGRL